MAKDRFGYGISDTSFNELREISENGKIDIVKYLESGAHDEWLKQEWNQDKDINLVKNIIKAVRSSMIGRGSSSESFLDAYSKMLHQIATKNGSPSAKDIHNMLGEE